MRFARNQQSERMQVLNNGCSLLWIFCSYFGSGFLGDVLELVGGQHLRGFGALLWVGKLSYLI